MRYTFGASGVIERLEVLALPDDVKSLFGDLHNCQDVLPLVLFTDHEFVVGSNSNSAAVANETNERDIAL